MTFRLTCLLIFLIVSASAVDSTSTAELTTETAPVTAPTGPNFKCPSGDDINDDGCNNRKQGVSDGTELCAAENICYRDMMKNSGVSTSACCGRLGDFCPSTRLFSYHSGGQTGFLYKYTGEADDPRWYKRDYPLSGDVACPIPFSFTLKNSNVVPLTWAEEGLEKSKANNQSYKVKTCTTNSECGDGNFCDSVYNPTFKNHRFLDRSGPKESSLQFCYKQPDLKPDLKHVKVDLGLKLCHYNEDCGNETEICHIDNITVYANVTQPEKIAVPGICVHVDVCSEADDEKTHAVLPVNSQFCKEDMHCQNAGVSANQTEYSHHCRSYSDPNNKVCCFKKKPKCKHGTAETQSPVANLMQCKKYEDCAGDLKSDKKRLELWCDEKVNVCCKDIGSTVTKDKHGTCLDYATPLYNEPKCVDVVEGKESSGVCKTKGGVCRFGHCCPSLTLTIAPSGNGTESATPTLGPYPYLTNYPCDANKPIPSQFSTYAFCDPDTNRVGILGKRHLTGEERTEVKGSACSSNKDCKSGTVCVYVNINKHVCYYHPLKKIARDVSQPWLYVLISFLICGFIFVILAVMSFVCYRSKSVFDKYKPKKKGGKKGKDSDGKKGKKGGKKGDDTSKSKSSKSKTKKTEADSTSGTTGEGATSSQMN
ncbi:uncharacterized protein CELE_T10E9.4 [Caenorhabditis elegans]|uniref:Domain of unknown function DX domain-containing protein n=1 Tax=Caenorhabditis elegans TaxID=6239 RepID=O01600_CAEEL|nr:protein of unknown function DX domain-containing protein [Caenorhabditis elegans]CCD68104.1 Domain of unknown function DX domain-containing protein [Caenorhabditis elegans]|eukprot:NP_491879.2 Uncharacterized protein CELE_T10E9.4 [Caenorhabditis elegans]